ncbi:hypothetical protein L1987_10287 [Smallanthus sonchifolius]|uniref:Uncharacterized protein n=1 Tax=Smallanthus sonchifolius TaxID=185202 RepID=A0ACB9JRP0_9ASTR|nr:hypothetical protein L1987_10287 [Smallanthus sonchifolius]
MTAAFRSGWVALVRQSSGFVGWPASVLLDWSFGILGLIVHGGARLYRGICKYHRFNVIRIRKNREDDLTTETKNVENIVKNIEELK